MAPDQDLMNRAERLHTVTERNRIIQVGMEEARMFQPKK